LVSRSDNCHAQSRQILSGGLPIVSKSCRTLVTRLIHQGDGLLKRLWALPAVGSVRILHYRVSAL
jgi:hypothetical protein